MRERMIALLAYLLLHRGKMLHRDVVAFALWPDHDEVKARANLRRHMHLINKSFEAGGGPSPLAGKHRSIGWNPGCDVWVDLVEFERLAEAPETAHEAVDLYAGDFLMRQDYDWATDARERLRRRAMTLLEELAERARERGDFAAAIGYCRRLLQLDPWREDTVRRLIALRRLSGDGAGAAQEYRAFAQALRDEMGAEPMPETRAMLEEESASLPRRASRGNVPAPVTKFLGRDRELEELTALAQTRRLVTLVGFGGIGKTRLALEYAKRVVDSGTQEVCFVPLSTVTDPALVPSALLQALSLREEGGKSQRDTLLAYLQERSELIVFDACENVAEALALLCTDLLRSCADLRVVATSRVVLGCAGEATFRLSPFGESDGVSLFCERAAAVLPSFTLTPINAPLISHIVRRLDGIPLALEIAAARAKVMSLQSLSRRLDDRFEILSRGQTSLLPGQQTLQAAIDWSFGLLTEDERRLFARLAIFASSWTLETAETVCAGDGLERDQIVDILTSLLDKSLLQLDYQADETRFYYLDTVRAYASKKLAAAGDDATVRANHLAWCVEFAERMEPLLSGAEQGYASTCIKRELDNIRLALETALAPGAATGMALRLTGAMGRYWFLYHMFAEGETALAAALRAGEDGPPGLRAKSLSALAYLVSQRRDFEASARIALDVLHGLREHADDRTVALALMVATVSSIFGSTGFEAGPFLEELEARAERIGDLWSTALPTYATALAAMKEGDTPRAAELLERTLEIVRVLEDPYDICSIALALGYSKFQLGDVSGAASLFIESAERGEPLRNLVLVGQCAEGLAFVASSLQLSEDAGQLFGAADALRAKTDAPRWPYWQSARERHWSAARSALGDETFDTFWTRGHALALEDPYAAIRQFASTRPHDA
jgi:predicted ATPase/DNA-binding SARP family transcriptional activator